MEKKERFQHSLLFTILLICLLSLAGGHPAKAAKYVKQTDTTVSITSSKTGWVRINGSWYYYDRNGKMRWGSISYKKNYYYCKSDGKRVTGFVSRNGSLYYYSATSGKMLKSRWLTKSGKKYYLSKSGKALTSQWLTLSGKKYYFNSKSRMVTGWKKIGGYYYYFNSKGVMQKSKWVGIYYVGKNGRRTSKTRALTTVNAKKTKYTYTSTTLNIDLRKKTKHGVSYWVAHVKTASASQLNSALSYGTYGGTRQTTSSAVSSNGGIIGVNGGGFDYDSGKPWANSMCIKNGIVYADHATDDNVMAVTWDGIMYRVPVGSTAADLIAAGVKDTYVFGPALIIDGVSVYKEQVTAAEALKYYPRTAVGMVSQNDYVLVVTDTGSYSGLNGDDLVSIFLSYGCQFAFNLDGGGSSTLYFNGQVMNALINDYQRPCADFLYFTR